MNCQICGEKESGCAQWERSIVGGVCAVLCPSCFDQLNLDMGETIEVQRWQQSDWCYRAQYAMAMSQMVTYTALWEAAKEVDEAKKAVGVRVREYIRAKAAEREGK